MNRYRVMLADDHALLRKGLKRILEESDEIEISGEASDGLELLNMLKTMVPDILLIDISMPNLSGIEVLGIIRSGYPGIKIVVLTMHKDVEYLNRAFSLGAEGYLLKEESDTELFNAIDRVRRGEKYISPSLSGDLATLFSEADHGKPAATLHIGELTPREKEILKMIAGGRKSKDIACRLSISVRTVEAHRANIMTKLHLGRGTSSLSDYASALGDSFREKIN